MRDTLNRDARRHTAADGGRAKQASVHTHDACILHFLGAELELLEAALPLPAPPRVPTLLANVPRILRTPAAGMAAVDAKTIAPRKAA